MNPLVGRHVRLERDGDAVVTGLVIDSFYTDNFYRLVVEIEEPSIAHATGKGRVAVFPIGNGRTAFVATMEPPSNASKLIVDERDLRCTIFEGVRNLLRQFQNDSVDRATVILFAKPIIEQVIACCDPAREG
jgi:hypothetical protein